jgi:hypothetical protein
MLDRAAMLTFLKPLFDRFQTATQAPMRAAVRHGMMFIAPVPETTTEVE